MTAEPATRSVAAGAAEAFAAAILTAYGASRPHASAVADHLVESERMGVPSHGLIRLLQYVREIEAGLIQAAAEPEVASASPGRAVIDGHWTFGQVAGLFAVDLLSAKVKESGVAFVAARRIQHSGRLGAYTERLAAFGYFAMAFAAGAPRFHRVAPFGGREGRMSTNPISWAAPAVGRPLVADFSTSAIPEGRVRVMQALGEELPPDTICDSAGRPSNDPSAFYGTGDPATRGYLLPLGGSSFGHKGYALGLLVECLATLMAGDDTDATSGRGNNLALVALQVDEDFAERTQRLVAYMKSAQPADPMRPVQVPGEREQARLDAEDRLDVPASVWTAICELGARRDVSPPPDVTA